MMNSTYSVKRIFAAGLLTTVGLISATTQAETEDQVNAEGTTITGNQELPLGLYIIPWRDPEPVKIKNEPTRLVVEELVPLDPDVFRRQIRYYDAISGNTPE